MAWCHQATSHYLSQCHYMVSLGHIELRKVYCFSKMCFNCQNSLDQIMTDYCMQSNIAHTMEMIMGGWRSYCNLIKGTPYLTLRCDPGGNFCEYFSQNNDKILRVHCIIAWTVVYHSCWSGHHRNDSIIDVTWALIWMESRAPWFDAWIPHREFGFYVLIDRLQCLLMWS